jgi:hypothetical protein
VLALYHLSHTVALLAYFSIFQIGSPALCPEPASPNTASQVAEIIDPDHHSQPLKLSFYK